MPYDHYSDTLPQLTQPLPLLTVVTVCYNASSDIGKTIHSVLGQTYPNIEYIIIDGGSTDGTQNIISKYIDKISYFVSEPDRGIYDAMNKGVVKSSGDWIIFINAGDYLYKNTTIADVFAHIIDDEIDFIYGDYVWNSASNEVIIPSRSLELMWQKISFSHQSLFVRTVLMKELKFDLNYRIVSDYNFYFSCYMHGRKFLKVNFPISVFLAGGMSDVNFLLRTYERWKVVVRYKKDIKVHLYYIKLIISYCMGRVKKIFNNETK